VNVSATASHQRVVVIGGGITGLTTCYRLYRQAGEHNLPLAVTLLEASGRLGGVIATSQHQDLLLEHGPDCFISSKPWGKRLCEEIGFSNQLISTTTQYRQSFIVRGGKLVPVPQGLYLMVPGSLWSLAASPILSWRGKLRLALDLFLPRRIATADESLAHFVTRRLGWEALQRIAQPMVGGIYTGDPEQLSLQATLPQFLDMEQRHGSLIRALWHNQRLARRQGTTMQGTSGPRYGLFVSCQHGMQTLVDRLAACLPAPTVRLHARVRSLERRPGAARWLIHLDDQPALEADAVCVALPAPQAGRLFVPWHTALAATLQDIPYASSAIVNVAFRRADVAHPLHGMGFVVPAVESRTLMACSFSSVKFPGRAPPHQVLLRAFVGGALHKIHYDLPDDAMQRAVLHDLRDLLGITGAPLCLWVSRHPQAMPQYHVGHRQRVEHLETLLRHFPGLVLAGNAYHGVGIPDCIHSGEMAAQAVLRHLRDAPLPFPIP
jgi:protoporphyrinogen/coproporphyrinogen III oxidase